MSKESATHSKRVIHRYYLSQCSESGGSQLREEWDSEIMVSLEQQVDFLTLCLCLVYYPNPCTLNNCELNRLSMFCVWRCLSFRSRWTAGSSLSRSLQWSGLFRDQTLNSQLRSITNLQCMVSEIIVLIPRWFGNDRKSRGYDVDRNQHSLIFNVVVIRSIIGIAEAVPIGARSVPSRGIGEWELTSNYRHW